MVFIIIVIILIISLNCVPQLAKKGVVVSDSPVRVAKIDTAYKSNISILKKKDHENVGINMIEF